MGYIMAGIPVIDAAIFDMDGLLINSEPFWKHAELAVLKEAGIDLQLKKYLPDTTGLRIDQVMKLWLQAAKKPECAIAQLTEQITERVVKDIMTHKPMMPGVKHALQLCQQQGLKIGLASASPRSMINTVLQVLQIEPFFDAVCSAETLPYSKPHPQVYLNAAQALGVDPLRCVALEDSRNGMIAASAARMRVIVVPAAEQAVGSFWSLANVKLTTLQQLTLGHLGCGSLS